MKIIKGETEDFEGYEVISRAPVTFLGIQFPWSRKATLKGVLEADDQTGRVVQQVISEEGYPVFSNGADDLYNDNSMKLMLLIPGFAKSLLEAGFRPKTTTIYDPKLRIINRSARAVAMITADEAIREVNG